MNQHFHSDDADMNHPAGESLRPDVQSAVELAEAPATAEPQGAQSQVQARLLHLASQVDRIQAQLDRLSGEVQDSSQQVAALLRHLTALDTTRPIEERLADLLTRLEANQEQLADLTQKVTKLSRTQFRSNVLAESKEQQIAAALATLQEIATRREEAREARDLHEQQRLSELQSEARAEMAAELLPALDSLELALDNGRSLLERHRRRVAQARAALTRTKEREVHQSTWRKLRRVLAGELVPAAPQVALESAEEMTETMTAWLKGLELVRERFLGLLAAEGVQPIPAEGQTFDPRLHVAVEAEVRTDVPPGTVVAVQRRGYRQGDRVLRYAEVVVARAPDEGAQVDEETAQS